METKRTGAFILLIVIIVGLVGIVSLFNSQDIVGHAVATCGNGFCSDYELKYGTCPADCGATCVDHDGGIDLTTPSYAEGEYLFATQQNIREDTCSGDVLYEMYCADNYIHLSPIDCAAQYGDGTPCVDGACYVCEDTDGMDTTTVGFIEGGTFYTGQVNTGNKDECAPDGRLQEFLCTNGYASYSLVDCKTAVHPKSYCYKGACVVPK